MHQPKVQLKEKIIRDTIHGNISFNPKFINIIDSPEFQRLRRIRQVSTAFFIFPSAEHNRFSHSIGTYHVMKLIIQHFKELFAEIGFEIPDRSVDLALAVALLHDIGHGPFSHAFEDALPKEKYMKTHEQWTMDIIKSPDSQIHHALVKSFDPDFPNEVADLIKKERDVKHNRSTADSSQGINLFFILSSLISSQLDADRMDYLLRDAFFTGVTYGNYDIERLIKSLTITVNENKYFVCVHEKYLPTIEEYLVARYQMHDSVYFHPFKVQMEIIVSKILHRAYELYCNKLLSPTEMPQTLIKLFEGQPITIEEYTKLDDALFMSLFGQLQESSDKVLSLLCSAFIDRNKFRELAIFNNSETDLQDFQTELIELLRKHGLTITNLNDEYFWISKTSKNTIYKRKDGEIIWVLKNNGTLVDLLDISKVVHEKLAKSLSSAYLNLEILKQYISITDPEALEDDIEHLIYMFNNRTHIEIEKKYYVKNKQAFEEVQTFLRSSFSDFIKEKDTIGQSDTYYDTAAKLLYSSNRTLRIRKVSSNYTLTIKVPTRPLSSTEQPNRQNERFEYEKPIENCSLESARDYISKYVPEFTQTDHYQFIKTLEITNHRKKICLDKNNIVFEVAFDDVTFNNPLTNKQHHEFQIEIELKSDFIHRVNLKHLTDQIEQSIKGLTPTTESKYERGLCMTK
jgi:HD superfamily phosphohydrolase/uncharacterized protein YjbK